MGGLAIPGTSYVYDSCTNTAAFASAGHLHALGAAGRWGVDTASGALAVAAEGSPPDGLAGDFQSANGHIQPNVGIVPKSKLIGTYTSGIVLTSPYYANPVTVTSTGRITANTGGPVDAITAVSAWTIVNYGQVLATEYGIALPGGAITNAAGAVVSGDLVGISFSAAGSVSNSGVIYGYRLGMLMIAGGTVTNRGLIHGGDTGIGVEVEGAGQISNQAGGVITAQVGVIGTNALVDNTGSIYGSAFAAVLIGGSAFTNRSGGSVYGRYFGLKMLNGGPVVNMTGGTIAGGVGVYFGPHGSGTLIDAGTISGRQGVAVEFYGTGANRLIVDAGAAFLGNVKATAGTDVLELATGAGTGTLSGLGSAYTGFQTVTIDSGAAWTVKGAQAGISGVVIGGFTKGDSIDVTDLAFAPGDTATLVAGGVLDLFNAGRTIVGWVTLSGSFVGYVFNATGDGTSGTRVTLAKAGPKSVLVSTYGDIVLTSASYANPVTVTSTGKVSGSGNALSAASPWTIANYGSISGAGYGIFLAGGAVTNAAGETIAGGGAIAFGAAGSVSNGGVISGTTGYGISFAANGTVANAGSIQGAVSGLWFSANAYLGNAGTIGGGVVISGTGTVSNQVGGVVAGKVGISGGTVTLDNAGNIHGNNYGGVSVHTAALTNHAGASIRGQNYGVRTFYGSITNQAGGAIIGNTGIVGGGTVENAGTIAGSQGVAVDFYVTGANRVIVDAGATFQGKVEATAGTDTLELTSGAAVGTLSGFGSQYTGFPTVTIDSGAAWTIKGAEGGFAGVTLSGFNTHDTVDLTDVGFASGDTVRLSAADMLTLYNAGHTAIGSIQLSGGFTGYAFGLSGDGGSGTDITLTKLTPKTQIGGTYASGVVLTTTNYANPVTVTSTGRITGPTNGISAASAWTIANYGSVSGGVYGVWLLFGGAVTNAAGGTISGGGAVMMGSTGGSVANHGLISGKSTYGVTFASSGTVTNSGTIQGAAYSLWFSQNGYVDNTGTISGRLVISGTGQVSNHAGGVITGKVGLAGSTVALDNSGYIHGSNYGGVVVHAGTLTNHGGGSIRGQNYGVRIFGGSVVNQSGGMIAANTGLTGGGNLTVENAGTISGSQGVAVDFYYGTQNRLIIDAGAVFQGKVEATAGADTIELTSGASAGTLSGLGSAYTGFQTVTIDTGAGWTIQGAKAGFSGVTVGGFNTHDTIDLTDVAFASGDTATLNGANLLTVANSGGTTLATVQLTSNAAGLSFIASSDGKGGTDIAVVSNLPPVTTVPVSLSVITGATTKIAGLGVADGDAVSASETITVVLKDTTGALSATAATGATVAGSGGKSLTLSGTLAGVNAELATVTYKGSLSGTAASATDTISVTSSDGRGGSDSHTIAVKINHVPPAITAPKTLKELSGQAATLSGFTISDTDTVSAAGSFTVTLSDTTGLLSAAVAAGGAVAGANTNHLVLTGSLAAVNAELATLTYTGGSIGTKPTLTDTLSLTAADSRGGSSTSATTITVYHLSPVMTVPIAVKVASGVVTAIKGVGFGDSDPTAAGATFTARITDQAGLLSATAAAGGSVAGANSKTLTLKGSLSAVNQELATLTYKDTLATGTTSASDMITVTTTDAYGDSSKGTIAITVTPTGMAVDPRTLLLGQFAATGLGPYGGYLTSLTLTAPAVEYSALAARH